MTNYMVTVTLKTGEVYKREMTGGTYGDILDQVKSMTLDANDLKLVEAVEQPCTVGLNGGNPQ